LSVIETERLILTEFKDEDADFIIRLLNSPGWLKYIGTRNIQTPEDARKYITEKLAPSYQKNGFGFYHVRTRSGNESVGMCGLIKREGLDDVDIGFALLPEHEGKGYAYEAASATMIYAKDVLKLKRVAAITVPYNKASIKLLEKIGLKFDKMINLADDKEELMYFINSFN
jgi:[ribosomal protein S5]-alanine N-acetyltransferase